MTLGQPADAPPGPCNNAGHDGDPDDWWSFQLCSWRLEFLQESVAPWP